jgi:hypothetical protein
LINLFGPRTGRNIISNVSLLLFAFFILNNSSIDACQVGTRWGLDTNFLEIIKFCGLSHGETYKIYDATFCGLKVSVRGLPVIHYTQQQLFKTELEMIR